MGLIIVESPTKIKTLRKILGQKWEFKATKGHIYDLPKSEMGVDDDYNPDWQYQGNVSPNEIQSAASKHDDIYIAADPDREGEAIAWQVDNLVLKNHSSERIRLESITKNEVKNELRSPGTIDNDLVQAQWARRLLDRLAGYKISPFLISAFNGKKLSAGRVQSAVLAQIVKRQNNINEFEPETFFNIKAFFQPDQKEIKPPIKTKLAFYEGDEIGTGDNQRLIKKKKIANNIITDITENGFLLQEKKQKETKTHPGKPFNSSTLIKRASQWFNWPSSKTMNIAQSLYESGLITYHRSDSTKISQTGCKAAAAYINDEYGNQSHQWRGGGGGSQQGHEAIRAKNPSLEPSDLNKVSDGMRTLYGLIWQQYIQSQMTAAVWNTIELSFKPKNIKATFQGQERAIKEWGFYKCSVNQITPPPETERSGDEIQLIATTDSFKFNDYAVDKSETRGPRPYTEGTLVTMMKKTGIGRPSTYSATLSKLKKRDYIKIKDKKIKPTDRGEAVCNYLKRTIDDICNPQFTREMEEQLDKIANGKLKWKDFVKRFDNRLDEWLDQAQNTEPKMSAARDKTELDYATCPLCDSDLIKRKGQYGYFVHCTDDDCEFSSDVPAKTYKCPECDRHMVKGQNGNSGIYNCIDPDCSGKRPVGEPNMTYEEYNDKAPECPECEGDMELRSGKYGSFWGCVNYPDCNGTVQT